MSFFNRFGVAVALIAISGHPGAWAAPPAEKPGSLYVQCDGNPNNVTSGERAARLIGAVTLLGLFAPPMEDSDASKRKFGAEGVAICSSLIDAGEKMEGNPHRRIDLILARALHHIEAKDYEAARTDALLARREAEAAGMMADPYFVRSKGRGFDLVEGAALYRLGRVQEAQEATLRSLAELRPSPWALITTRSYAFALPIASEKELHAMRSLTRIFPSNATEEANRLEEMGRFAEATQRRDAYAHYQRTIAPEHPISSLIARAAISHALAGDRATAAQRAKEARANFEKRKTEGKPESDSSAFVELMDFYDIVETAAAGDLKTARRQFAGRSAWVEVSLGAVMEMNKRLRVGATADELVGALSHDAGQLWKEREDNRRAALIATDTDNKSLFALIPLTSTASSYEAVSRQVWRTEKSPLLLKLKSKEAERLKGELMVIYQRSSIALDSYLLHAALLAKSRGHKGFVFRPFESSKLLAVNVITGNPGDPGLTELLFNDADDVIAALSPVIPSPEMLKTRRGKKA